MDFFSLLIAQFISIFRQFTIFSKSLFMDWSYTTGIKSPKYKISILFFSFSIWELNNKAEKISAVKTVNTSKSNFVIVDFINLVNIKIILAKNSLIYVKITKTMIVCLK